MKKLLAILLTLCLATGAFAALTEEQLVDLCSKPNGASQILAELAQGANPNARDSKRTLLGQACFYAYKDGMKDVVTALLDKGADVNATCSSTMETPLMRAADECGPEIVKRMIAMGANVNAASKEGETALAKAGSAEIAQILLDAGAQINDVTMAFACQYPDRPEVVKMLLARGANAAIVTGRGRTLLHTAAAEGCPSVIRVLAAHGLDVNARDKDGETPLIRLARSSGAKNETALALIECGADVNARDEEGYSPLYLAVSRHLSADLALCLLDHGATANEPDGVVYTFYDLLVRNKGKMRDEKERQKLIDRIHPVKK